MNKAESKSVSTLGWAMILNKVVKVDLNENVI